MRLIYFPFIAVLLWLFVKVLRVLSNRDAILTPILGWIVGLAFFLLAPLTIIVLNGGYQSPDFYKVSSSHADVNLSSLESMVPFFFIWAALLFSFASVLIFLPASRPGWKRRELVLDDVLLKRVIVTTACITFVHYAITIYLLGGIEEYLITNWYLRGTSLLASWGDRYVLYLWLAQANQMVFTAAAALYTHSQARRGLLDWRYTSVLILLFLLWVAFQGDRIYLALYLLSLVTSCWLYRRKKVIVGLLIAAPMLALVFSAWSFFRNAPTEIVKNVPAYLDADLGNRTVTALMDAFDGSDTVFLFHIINDFGSKYHFLYGESYTRILLFVLPRSIYPDKPETFTLQLAELYEPGETSSFAATELGELYANFGPVSVWMLPLMTLCILFASEALMQRLGTHALFSAEVFLLMMWCARATVGDNFIMLVFVVALTRMLRLERNLVRQAPEMAATILRA